MRLYTKQHKHYCGIDLHTNKMYLCILNQEGDILLHRNIRTEPETFLKTITEKRKRGPEKGTDLFLTQCDGKGTDLFLTQCGAEPFACRTG